MRDFEPGAFFECRSALAEDLFSRATKVWDILKFLQDFIQEVIRPGIAAQVEEGAWVEKGMVEIAHGSKVERGAVVRGPTIIGQNTIVRTGAYIRPNVIIGDGCIIGHGTELRHSVVLNNSRLPHFNCVMTSVIGNRVTFGACAATSSIVKEKEVRIRVLEKGGQERWVPTGLERLGAIVGDDFECGGHVFMRPGTLIGKRCRAEPLTCISGLVEAGSWIR